MPDADEYAEMAALVEELDAASAELRAIAADADVPAVERNAARVQAAVRVLSLNLPPELREE